MAIVLDFEKPIVEIQKKIDELKQMSEVSGLDIDKQIETFEKQAQDYKKACDLLADERHRFSEKLSKIKGIKVYPSQANYIMCKFDGKENIKELTIKLLQQHNLLIKDLSPKYGFDNGNFMRLAVMRPAENDLVITGLMEEVEKNI